MGQRGNITKASVAARTAPRRQLEPFSRSDARLSPEMEALSERQRRFVEYLLETGSDNHTAALRFAGYSGTSEEGIRVAAYRMAHDPRVQNALRAESERRLRGAAILASSQLIKIAGDPGHKDQLKAIGMLLDRVGLHSTTEQKISVEHTMSEADMRKRIMVLCREMDLDPEKMLGAGARDVKLIEGQVVPDAVEVVP